MAAATMANDDDDDEDDDCSDEHKKSTDNKTQREREKREMAIVKIYAILNECHILIAAPRMNIPPEDKRWMIFYG